MVVVLDAIVADRLFPYGTLRYRYHYRYSRVVVAAIPRDQFSPYRRAAARAASSLAEQRGVLLRLAFHCGVRESDALRLLPIARRKAAEVHSVWHGIAHGRVLLRLVFHCGVRESLALRLHTGTRR